MTKTPAPDNHDRTALAAATAASGAALASNGILQREVELLRASFEVGNPFADASADDLQRLVLNHAGLAAVYAWGLGQVLKGEQEQAKRSGRGGVGAFFRRHEESNFPLKRRMIYYYIEIFETYSEDDVRGWLGLGLLRDSCTVLHEPAAGPPSLRSLLGRGAPRRAAPPRASRERSKPAVAAEFALDAVYLSATVDNGALPSPQPMSFQREPEPLPAEDAYERALAILVKRLAALDMEARAQEFETIAAALDLRVCIYSGDADEALRKLGDAAEHELGELAGTDENAARCWAEGFRDTIFEIVQVAGEDFE